MKLLFPLAVSSLLIISACKFFREPATKTDRNETIVGTWFSNDDNGSYLVLRSDRSCDLLDKKRRSVFGKEPSENCEFETVEEVTPHHLYLHLKHNGEKTRFPVGIYVLSGDKLVVRNSSSRQHTIGGFPIGSPDFTIPSDFGGPLTIYRRITETEQR